MRHSAIVSLIFVGALHAVPAQATENSNRVEGHGTRAQAWALLGDFCGISRWHPVIASCVLSEKDGDKIRTLKTQDGAIFVEKLVKWDDAGTSYTYAILQSPLPLTDYVSTLKVEDDDEPGKVAITWSSKFTPKGVSDDEARKVVSGIYLAGLIKLKSELNAK